MQVVKPQGQRGGLQIQDLEKPCLQAVREKRENGNGKNEQLNRDGESGLDLGVSGCPWRICWNKNQIINFHAELELWKGLNIPTGPEQAGSVFGVLAGSGVSAVSALPLISVPYFRAVCRLPPHGKHSQPREAGG